VLVEEEVAAPGLWQRVGPQVFEALRIFGIVWSGRWRYSASSDR